MTHGLFKKMPTFKTAAIALVAASLMALPGAAHAGGWGNRGGWHNGGGPYYGGPYRYGRSYHNDHNNGGWLAAGLITGAIVGMALAQPVYAQPEPVYVQPQPVYASPPVVYAQPQYAAPVYAPPVVYAAPQPVYVQPYNPWRFGGIGF